MLDLRCEAVLSAGGAGNRAAEKLTQTTLLASNQYM
jgi:hypothetical protein